MNPPGTWWSKKRSCLSAELSSLFQDPSRFLPWVSFMAGLSGSLHCAGMCGGLVTATCGKNSDIFRYQFGRLLGYLLLAAIAGVFGSVLNFRDLHPALAIAPAILLGLMFIYWGIQSLNGRRAELPLPSFMSVLYGRLWGRLVQKNKTFTRSFFTGFISILLPCGLLYGVVITLASLQNTSYALISMFFFWLGTVPSMVLAPGLIRKIIEPLKVKLPRTFAVSLVLIGIFTISFRVMNVVRGPASEAPKEEAAAHHQCH